jgi:hypothetical protein
MTAAVSEKTTQILPTALLAERVSSDNQREMCEGRHFPVDLGRELYWAISSLRPKSAADTL